MNVDDLVTRSEDAHQLHPHVGRIHETFGNDSHLVLWGNGDRSVESSEDLARYRIG